MRRVHRTLLGAMLALVAEVGLIIAASAFRNHGGLWLFAAAFAASTAWMSWLVYERLPAQSRAVRGVVGAVCGIVISAAGVWAALIVLIAVHGE